MNAVSPSLAKRGKNQVKRRVTIDFETRSKASLKDVGATRYSLDKSTGILMLSWKFHGRDEVKTWWPDFPSMDVWEDESDDPQELIDAIEDGYEVEAHNAGFERAQWNNVLRRLHKRFKDVVIKHRQWRCSAAKAASMGLPRALEDVARVLRVREQKDTGEGHKAMMRLARWRKPTKRLPGRWHEDKADFVACVGYNKQDVRAEEAVSESLPDLEGAELALWQLDQQMNEWGVPVDREGVEKAVRMLDDVQSRLTAEMELLVEWEFSAPSQRERLKDWVRRQGLPLADTQATTVDEVIPRVGDFVRDPEAAFAVRRVLEICRAVNRSSTAKYRAILDRLDDDGYMHDLFMFHGASTGRFTGKGPQPHNFVRGFIKDMAGAWEDIHGEDLRWIEALWGDAMEFLSWATRGAICAPDGEEFAVADFNAIEARVLFWLAGDEGALRVLRSGGDIYMDMATSIYGYRVHDKVEQALERRLGKTSILGLGYGMGPDKFVETAAKDGIVLDYPTAKKIVDVYRKKHRAVKKYWYDNERAAIEAVRNPGRRLRVGKCVWAMEGRFLTVALPSGRKLHYCDPRVMPKKTPWGEEKDALFFMGVDDKGRWALNDTYGGKLVENIVQATARDILRDSMLRTAGTREYGRVLMSVHDELVNRVARGVGSAGEFEVLVAALEPWADGCPITAEGWIGRRYKK